MFDLGLRGIKDRVMIPICGALPAWITPNQITLIGFSCGLLSVAMTIASSPGYGLIFWILNRAFDGFDGSLARRRGTSSDLGGFLDLLADFLIYSLLPIAVAYSQDAGPAAVDGGVFVSPSWRAVAWLEACIHINNFVLFYVAAVQAGHKAKLAEAQRVSSKEKSLSSLTSVEMPPALIEGLEAGMFFTAMLVWPDQLIFIAYGMAVAVAIGVLQRLAFVLPFLRLADAQQQAPGT